MPCATVTVRADTRRAAAARSGLASRPSAPTPGDVSFGPVPPRPDALGEHAFLEEIAGGVKRHGPELGLERELGMGLDLRGERLRDPERRQLEGVRDDHQARLVALGPPARVQAGRDHVPIGRQGERNARPGQEVAGQAVDPDRHGIDRPDQAVGGQVGQSDPQRVAARLDGQVEDGEPGDHRAGQVGHRLDPLAADDVRVQAGPAVVLAELAHDQHVDLVEGQPAHQLARLVEQARLDLQQAFRLDGDDSRRVLEGVFQDRDSQRHGRSLEQEGADLGKHGLEAGQAELVDLGRALPFPQADGQHLQQAALVPAGERGVGLDPVEEDDPVGVEGVLVEVDGQAERVLAQDHGVHLGRGRGSRPWPRSRPARPGAALAVGGSAAVRAHGRDDERLEPETADRLGHGANDPGKPGDSPAAHGDGDPSPGEHARGQVAGADRLGHLGGDIGDLRLDEVASDAGDRWEIHRWCASSGPRARAGIDRSYHSDAGFEEAKPRVAASSAVARGRSRVRFPGRGSAALFREATG